MALTNSLLTATGTIIFLASNEQAITTVLFCNSSPSTDATVDVYAVPNGGVTGTGTIILNNLSLPARETFVFDSEKLILSNGDRIVAASNVDNIVVATVSSVGL